jgi:hypothetical protein
VQVPQEERQWSHDKKMFLLHPPTQTDSFILFVKSVILLSHVKNFNLRFRGQYFSSNITMFDSKAGQGNGGSSFNPRDTAVFRQLDHITATFRMSFPSHLRNPVQGEMVDAYLFAASSAAYL